ncbi:MAG TPA: glycosyltransferase, partial [Gemmatimonadaceae bacterium]|nr:glycosyltransferase [Gemmatimonadaceae bacterium]
LVKTGATRVSTVHGFTGGDWRNRFYETLQRASYHRLDVVVAVSTKIAEGLSQSKRVRRRVRTIANAWTPVATPLSRQDARTALGLSSESVVVGWVGRISREKGLDVMIDALALLKDRKLRLVVIGSGTERMKLDELAKLRGLDVVWSGHLPDAARYFSAFDIFVLSSRTEGTPMVLFEAMHSLIPIVATAVGGVPAVVSPNEASLVPPDNPEALASAIRDSLQHPDEARRRASLAQRRLSDTFSQKDWLARYDAVYSEVAGRRKPR